MYVLVNGGKTRFQIVMMRWFQALGFNRLPNGIANLISFCDRFNFRQLSHLETGRHLTDFAKEDSVFWEITKEG